MKKMLRLFLMLLSLAMASGAHAQSNRLYTIQNGMQTCDITSLTLDSRGLLWIGGNSSLCYFEGIQFHYTDNRDEDGRPYYNTIKQIVEDRDYCYWLLTDGGLFYFDSKHLTHERVLLTPHDAPQSCAPVRQMVALDGTGSETLVLTEGYGIYVLDNASRKVNTERTEVLQRLADEGFATCGFVDGRGDLWLGRINRSLVNVSLKDNQTRDIRMTDEARVLVGTNHINKMLEVPERKALYMATDGGILKYDYDSQVLEVVSPQLRIPFTSLMLNSSGELMAGSDSHGLWTIGTNDEVRPYWLMEPFFDLSMAKVKDITMDHEGNILIALQQKGLYVIPDQSDQFHYSPLSLNGDGRNTSSVSAICQDMEGRYWMGTDGAGVFTSGRSGLEDALPVNAGLRSLQIQGVAVDHNGTVWAGSYGGGVQCHVPGSQGFVSPDWLSGLAENTPVMSITTDRDRRRLYVCTNGMGIYVIDVDGKTCQRLIYHEGQSAWTVDLCRDNEEMIWVADVKDVYWYDERSDRGEQLLGKLLPGSPVCIQVCGTGSGKSVLVGTTDGLLVYRPSTQAAEVLLPGVRVQSVSCSEEVIWAASTSSVYCINRQNGKVSEWKNFGGLFLGEFHKRALYRNGQGELMWGCDNGILSFTPENIHNPHILKNKVLFTSLVVGGRNISYNTDPDILDANILSASQITLEYNNSPFSITFGVPDFGESPNTTYEYMLEGIDHEWSLTDINRARYSTLPYGTYKFHVRACIDGQPDPNTESVITIYVRAPWWATWWARLSYMLLAIALAYTVWRQIRSRQRRKQEMERISQDKEMKEAKLRMFTSITHELRSPLTMIVTPLRHLLTTTQDESLRNNLSIMLQNCNRLLNTVRQITDIRKIDAGQFQLHFEEVDLCDYTQDIAHSFKGTAMVRQIRFEVKNDPEPVMAWVDAVHFEKIIVNILSNAFKFCPDGRQIVMSTGIRDNHVRISIFNEGSPIGDEDMKNLYERFFQAKTGKEEAGSGIGLNLSLELMHLHHGNIEAHNVDGGVEFVLTLPLGNKHLSAEELSPRPTSQGHGTGMDEQKGNAGPDAMTLAEDDAADGLLDKEDGGEALQKDGASRNKARLLLVDDEKDIRDYLTQHLQTEYQIMTAMGGNMAWNIVQQSRPDIIITDVMMPDGNGIELVRRIKANPELDNIPIIMVTGEEDDSLQLKSLQLNVDHYLQKPFSIPILKGAVSQALGVRENIRRHAQRTDVGIDYAEMEMDSAEEQLFERVSKTLKKHLDDSEYGVQQLSEEVGISRVHLNRKMKERYGLTPNAFIKSFRLKQAAYLLVRNNVNVSEVAYKVGFSTHSHFTSSFREFFGMAPKEFTTFYKKDENTEALKKLLE